MRDYLWEHGLLMLVGVLLGVWFSESLSWLKLWVHNINWFLIAVVLLLLILYVPRSKQFLRMRGPREIIRGWRIQGERIRAKIIEEPDAKTEAERNAQKDRWWTMIRGTGTRYGWDQLAAAALGELNTAYRTRFEAAKPEPLSWPYTWKGQPLSQYKGAIIGRLNAWIHCLRDIEEEL